jgi:hypothetical protein
MRVYPSMLLSKGHLILLSLEVPYNPSTPTTDMSMGLSEDQAGHHPTGKGTHSTNRS